MKTIVALGGEGIGVEVVDATCELLAAAGFPLRILTPPHGEAAQKTHGAPVPDETKRLCGQADGILFGTSGGPASTAVINYLRWQQDAYAKASTSSSCSRTWRTSTRRARAIWKSSDARCRSCATGSASV